jgi:hypothetical protein
VLGQQNVVEMDPIDQVGSDTSIYYSLFEDTNSSLHGLQATTCLAVAPVHCAAQIDEEKAQINHGNLKQGVLRNRPREWK